MEFLINEVLELLPYIGLAGFVSYNKPSRFSPFPKEDQIGSENVQTGDDGQQYRVNPYSRNRTPIESYNQGINSAVDVEPGNTGIAQGPSSPGGSIVNKLDTSNIDFGNPEQVMQIQRALAEQGAVGEDGQPIKVDGRWGPNTEHAYRGNVNQRRENQGLLSYEYGQQEEEPQGFGSQVYDRLENAYETAPGNENPGPVQTALDSPETEWEDKNFFQKVGSSLPGVGGNPTLRDYWSNVWSGGNK
jgi:hypothetical protein